MNKIISLSLCSLFVLALACKKNPAAPPPTPLTITSISPSHVFHEEEITINGTGFDPDPTKNEVFFLYDFQVDVKEASATHLKVNTPPADLFGLQSNSSIRVKANGQEVESTVFINFKRRLTVTSVSHSAGNTLSNINIPGDSVIISGSGFSADPDRNRVTYDGNFLEVVSVDSNYWGSLRCFYPAIACIGGDFSDPDSTTKEVDLKVEAHNQTIIWRKRVQIFPLPTYQFISYTPSPVDPGYIFFKIRHKSVLPGTYIKISRVFTNNAETEISNSLLAQVYTDELKETNLNWLATLTPPGNYIVRIYRLNRVYINKTITII